VGKEGNMNYKIRIIQQIYLLLFVAAFALQAWRGVVLNGWGVLKSYLQLNDLKRSYQSIVAQNRQMIAEVKRLQINPSSIRTSKARKEFNLVNNPNNEVIIQFAD